MKNEKTKGQNRNSDRVALKSEVLQKVDGWITQLEESNKGINITRAEVANYILGKHEAALSESEIHHLSASNFDDVRFAAWALKALRQARSEGKNTSLRELIDQFSVEKTSPDKLS